MEVCGLFFTTIKITTKYFVKRFIRRKTIVLFKHREKFYFGSNINYIKELSNKKFNLDYKKINTSLNFGLKLFIFDKKLFKNINSLEPETVNY